MTSTEHIIKRLNAQKDAQDRKELSAQKRASTKLTKSVKVRGGGSRSALRSAGKSRGRGQGITIKNMKGGRGFQGAVSYASDDQKGAQLIAENGGLNSMIASAQLRPDIANPVAHSVLSLPPSTGRLDPRKWEQISDDFRKEMGIDDSFPFACYRHLDTDHDHAHIIYSRVSIDGRVHDKANINLRAMAAARVIEQKHSLPLVPTPPRSGPTLKKGEIEQALRTGQAPARLEIARALDIALADRPTLPQLVERLELSGITCKINQSQTTGKISGLSFEHGGITFKASQVGKQYGWQALSARLSDQEVTHDKARTSPQSAGDVHTERTSGTDNVRAVEPATPAIAIPCAPTFGGASPTPRATGEQKARPASPATARIPPGFASTQTLDDGLRDWVGTIGDRIRVRALAAHQRRQQLTALLDAQGRTAAIRTTDGWAIPDPSKLDDEQLAALIADLPEGVEIEIVGRESFATKARALRQPSAPTADAPEPANEPAIEWGEADLDAPAPRA